MQNRRLIFWSLVLVCVSSALLVWQHKGMNRELRFDVSSTLRLWAYDDREFNGRSVASVVRYGDTITLKCKLSRVYRWPFCGFNLGPGPAHKFYDLSVYDRMEVDISTGNTKNPVRVFLRNFNEAYSVPEAFNTLEGFKSLKVHELNYQPGDQPSPFVTSLDKFQVADWWINEKRVSPDHVGRDLSSIVNIGFGFNQNEQEEYYELEFRSITFKGKLVSSAQIKSFIIGLWITAAIFYLFFSSVNTRRAVAVAQKQKEALEEINAALELERKELEDLAVRDALTGVYNRFGLRNFLQAYTTLVKECQSQLSIIFMDMDNYKAINDTYGHPQGDEILKEFCHLIETTTRSQDVLCRWGGDEFILLCEGTSCESAKSLAEKLRSVILNHQWPSKIRVTCSFGVAQMDPNESVSNFVKRADVSLYTAKESGRNCIVSDTSDPNQKVA